MGDADDSYDFTDLGRFVEKLRGGADLVMGNRLAGEIKPGAMPWLHRWVGNPGLSWFLNLLFRTSIGDSHCGMPGSPARAPSRHESANAGMELASEMVIKSSLAKLHIEGRCRSRSGPTAATAAPTFAASATAGDTSASC